jgi:phosphoribosylanthranilate isomerase
MPVTRVKICGLTQQADLLHACAMGADAIGLVFYAPSKRFVRIDVARALAKATPPFVQRVGLFVDATKAEVEEVLDQVELDLLQFHGSEEKTFCESFSLPYIKALHARENVDLIQQMDSHPEARGFLLDTFVEGQPGGTGKTFDWSLFPEYDRPLILAGGLNAANVADAVAKVKPYAVDVSGGVEASAGIKDAEKVAAFIQNAKNAQG